MAILQIEPVLSVPPLPYTLESDESGITPPAQWDISEQILQVPYYCVFSHYSNRLRFSQLGNGQYGEFEGITRVWLRWLNHNGNWILADTEQKRQLADTAESKANALTQRLQELGLDL